MATLYRSGSVCFDRGKDARGGSDFWLGASGDEARGQQNATELGCGGEAVGGGPIVNCAVDEALRRRPR